MDPLGKRELLNFYSRHLRDFGDTPGALRWTPAGQLRRYEIFLGAIGDVSGKSLLDFGCGKGDFFGFLRENGVSPSYCGIDVNENLIELARQKYPGVEFIAMDIDEESFDRRFDVIVSIGVFNLRIAGVEESVKEILEKLFSLCGESLHVNFLTSHVARRNVELFYVTPEDILRFVIAEISPRVVLDHREEDIYLSVYRL